MGGANRTCDKEHDEGACPAWRQVVLPTAGRLSSSGGASLGSSSVPGRRQRGAPEQHHRPPADKKSQEVSVMDRLIVVLRLSRQARGVITQSGMMDMGLRARRERGTHLSKKLRS
jgi:hypothetical protein